MHRCTRQRRKLLALTILMTAMTPLTGGCSPGEGAPAATATTQPPIVTVASVSSDWLAEQVCNGASPDQRLDRADLVGEWETGTAMVEPITCDGSGGHGSGFLVAPDLVMTNAHVAVDAVVVRVEVGSSVVPGYVVGIDPVRDIALVQLTATVEGHVFSFSAAEPEVGVEVSALGYPIIRQFSASSGEISGVQRRFEVGDSFLTDAIQTSAPINAGNSGGPLIDDAG